MGYLRKGKSLMIRDEKFVSGRGECVCVKLHRWIPDLIKAWRFWSQDIDFLTCNPCSLLIPLLRQLKKFFFNPSYPWYSIFILSTGWSGESSAEFEKLGEKLWKSFWLSGVFSTRKCAGRVTLSETLRQNKSWRQIPWPEFCVVGVLGRCVLDIIFEPRKDRQVRRDRVCLLLSDKTRS
jgi:hypothetical protein